MIKGKVHLSVFLLALYLFCHACAPATLFQTNNSIQQILDEHFLDGAVVLFDEKENKFISNNFDKANQRRLPASTFKIPNTIIGLETGIIAGSAHIFPWDSVPRSMDMWNAVLPLRQGFQRSCVPCYREVARQIGTTRMVDYLSKLSFGDMIVSDENLDIFWLRGTSGISAMEQVDFLRRLKDGLLPIDEGTRAILLDILYREEENGVRISGKTGWAASEDDHQGWYVGFAEKDSHTYYFATSVQPRDSFDMSDFPAVRIRVTEEVLSVLGVTE